MARSTNEAILIVLDIGRSVGHEVSFDGKSFLSNAQLCATKIIQRNIFSQSKNEIGLILLGSEETNNPLADGEGYSNIEISHSLRLANWDMVRTISSFKKCTPVDGDWLDALIVAADYMKTATEGKIFKEKKIVMLTNFCSNVNDDEVNSVIQALQYEKVELIVIGPQVYATETQELQFVGQNKNNDQEEGEILIARIVDALENSVICSFEDALSQLKYFGQKKVRPTPWNTILDLGSEIKIPVSGYKKIAEVNRVRAHDIIIPSNINASNPPNQGSASQEENGFQVHSVKPVAQNNFPKDNEEEKHSPQFNLVDKDRVYKTVGNDATPVDSVDLIEGYMFGTTVVPVTEDDKPALMYESGPRCLSVLGFSNKIHVPMHLFKGECNQIFPRKEENCMRAFSAFVQALDSKDMVAIARKVYNTNNCPVICALFPMITPDIQCLVSIELPFSEQINTLVFPPLVPANNKPSSEQLGAVDQLIMLMDLVKVDSEEETELGAYDPKSTLDPYEQHYYSIIAQKALNGELYISGSDVDEAVKLLLSPKEELLEAAKPAIVKIQELFPLIEVTPKEGVRRAAADIFKQVSKPTDVADSTTSKPSQDKEVVAPHIGTIQPDEDFMNILSQGVPLEHACSLLDQVIMDMILKAFDADDFNKPFKSIVHMRKVCLEKNPSIYNNWIIKFKKDLPVEKIKFWELIVKDKAGLIPSSESKLSTVPAEEAEKLLLLDSVDDELQPIQSIDEDLDDLINQM